MRSLISNIVKCTCISHIPFCTQCDSNVTQCLMPISLLKSGITVQVIETCTMFISVRFSILKILVISVINALELPLPKID